MSTQAHSHLTRDSRWLSVVAVLAMGCVAVFVVALVAKLGSMHPPRALADPMGVSGVSGVQ